MEWKGANFHEYCAILRINQATCTSMGKVKLNYPWQSDEWNGLVRLQSVHRFLLSKMYTKICTHTNTHTHTYTEKYRVDLVYNLIVTCRIFDPLKGEASFLTTISFFNVKLFSYFYCGIYVNFIILLLLKMLFYYNYLIFVVRIW